MFDRFDVAAERYLDLLNLLTTGNSDRSVVCHSKVLHLPLHVHYRSALISRGCWVTHLAQISFLSVPLISLLDNNLQEGV